MTKEPTPPPKPRKPSASGESLASLRTQIDRLDRELVKLISQRAKLALQTAKHNEAAGDPPYQPTRETEILQHASSS